MRRPVSNLKSYKLKQMRQKKILLIADGMFINSNWLDSIAPLAPLLLPSGSPVH